MILVTGATGTVGREVVRQLAAIGVRIRAAIHTPSKAGQVQNPGVEIVALDYDRPQTYAPALTGVEKLFFVGFAGPHFAEISGNLARAAREAGVRHLVKLSAYGADFAPEFFIAKSHRDSEEAIEATGIAYTHLQPNVFMQNLVNYYGHSIREEDKFSLAQGDARVSFIDVRDVGAAAVAVLTQTGHEGQAYTLTGLEALSYEQAAAILSQAVGREITYAALSEEESRQQMQAMGRPDFLIEVGLNMDAFGRAGGFSRITSDFETVTGQKPISFEQFARDYAPVFK